MKKNILLFVLVLVSAWFMHRCGDASDSRSFLDQSGVKADQPKLEKPLAEETPAEETPAEETPAEETPAEETPAEETPAEETPAEETPAEETPAEETPAEETPAEETPAEETPAEETPAEETPAEETPAEETPAEETPAEETPAEETPAEETPAEETPAEETPAEETPAEETPAEETPAEETPAEETPAEETPAEETPAEETPAEETPAEETPAEETPAEETPAEETPAEETPAEETPAEETPAEETPASQETNDRRVPLLFLLFLGLAFYIGWELKKVREANHELGLRIEKSLADNSGIRESPTDVVQQPTKAPDHSLPIAIFTEIERMLFRLRRYEDSDPNKKPMTKALERMEIKLGKMGYERGVLIGKIYNEGMACKARFIPSEDSAHNPPVITRVSKPHVNFKGILVQVPEVEVSLHEPKQPPQE